MSFDHASSFNTNAAAYARSRSVWPDELFDWLASQAGGRRLAVDVGAGAGQASLKLKQCFRRVIAVDPGAELLAQIPQVPGLDRLQQRAEELEIGDRANVVTAFQSLHWFAGEAFNARVERALVPGGLFVAAGYVWFRVEPAVDALLHRELLPALSPHWARQNRLLFDNYLGLQFPWPEVVSPPAVIRLQWTRAELLGYIGTWSAVQRLREEGESDGEAGVLERFAAALAGLWPDGEVREVRMPLAVRAFRVNGGPLPGLLSRKA